MSYGPELPRTNQPVCSPALVLLAHTGELHKLEGAVGHSRQQTTIVTDDCQLSMQYPQTSWLDTMLFRGK